MSRYYPQGVVEREFARTMYLLAETLGAKLSEQRLRAYAQMLDDVPWPALRAALNALAQERQYPTMPTVGEVRARLGASEEDRGLLAWAGLCQAVERVGPYASLLLADGCAAYALRTVFGGWPAFCELDDGAAMGARRQEFLAAYRAAARQRREVDPPPGSWSMLQGYCSPSGQTPPGMLVGVAGSGWQPRLVPEREATMLGDGDGHAGAALPEGADAEAGAGPEAPR